MAQPFRLAPATHNRVAVSGATGTARHYGTDRLRIGTFAC